MKEHTEEMKSWGNNGKHVRSRFHTEDYNGKKLSGNFVEEADSLELPFSILGEKLQNASKRSQEKNWEVSRIYGNKKKNLRWQWVISVTHETLICKRIVQMCINLQN